MPSLSHRLVALALPRLNPPVVITDPERLRAKLVEKNRTRQTTPPAWLAKDFVVTEEWIGTGGGFPVYVATPRSGSFTRTLVHLHGGSYTATAHVRQWKFAAALARRTSARLVFPAYPLAPEFTWRDSVPALTGYVAGLCAEGEVVVSGDSAGGGLALAVALGVRDLVRSGEAPAQPAKLLLIAPWADLTRSAPGTEEAAARDPWLSIENHDTYALFWAGSAADLVLPQVSPALGDLTDLPPTMLLCGTHDMLYAGAEALAARAAAVGWPVVFEIGHGLLHVYPILPVAEARGALKRLAAFVRG
ncbi:alpha/beta hydrolase [Nocardioides jiangxiensis]|uniref:Alpha/beta hydrolase n=1 Tax=Nocardioides jiangxiensis TaxID=3064524 RepID=A0ABT9B245_9ACTN|nr:alpha/beta hydrolase [Nocardioides sp. WY-20]MDO7868825.1 alpha/beta hydrolase [Nocardioides sp. WY-20]